MHFLFATGSPYPPFTYGGAELSMHQLARGLTARGHTCEAVARPHGGLRAWLRDARCDEGNGYPTWRDLDVAGRVAARVHARRPDLVVAWNVRCVAVARAAARAGVPVLVWVPDVRFHRYVDWLPAGTLLAGSSRFVVDQLRSRVGREARLLYPYVETRRPLLRAPAHVTFLNPSRHKGADTVLEVARLLPRRRFLIVDSHAIGARERGQLRARAARLCNVAISPPRPSLDEVWATTALLIVPSRIPDASPRVIVEALAGRIPIVASRIGGIPELLDGGGTLLPREAPPAVWAAAVEAALDGPATVTGPRPELTPDAVTSAFLDLAAGAA